MLGFFSLIICGAEDASHEVKKKMPPGLLTLTLAILGGSHTDLEFPGQMEL